MHITHSQHVWLGVGWAGAGAASEEEVLGCWQWLPVHRLPGPSTSQPLGQGSLEKSQVGASHCCHRMGGKWWGAWQTVVSHWSVSSSVRSPFLSMEPSQAKLPLWLWWQDWHPKKNLQWERQETERRPPPPALPHLACIVVVD